MSSLTIAMNSMWNPGFKIKAFNRGKSFQKYTWIISYVSGNAAPLRWKWYIHFWSSVRQWIVKALRVSKHCFLTFICPEIYPKETTRNKQKDYLEDICHSFSFFRLRPSLPSFLLFLFVCFRFSVVLYYKCLLLSWLKVCHSVLGIIWDYSRIISPW